MTDSTYELFEHEDVVSEYASFDFLFGAEQVLLDELGSESTSAMLDVGVGGGRTTGFFADRAGSYVGVDVSRPMVEVCRKRFTSHLPPATVLATADARILPFADASFDLVLFSFNGLDVVGGHESRLVVLHELRRVTRAGASVWFSSSNLAFATEQLSARRVLAGGWRGASPRRIAGRVRRLRRARALNLPIDSLRTAAHAVVVEERHRFELHPERFVSPREVVRVGRYHIRPVAQIEQLRATGFGSVRVLTPDGQDVTSVADEGLAPVPWLQYAATSGGPGWSC